MKPFFRVWDGETKKYETGVVTGFRYQPVTLNMAGELIVETPEGFATLDPARFIFERAMNRQDKEGREIYEGDIVDVEAPNNSVKRYIVKFGATERVMDTDWRVEIIGFYFNPMYIKNDGFFSIVNNWRGGRDIDGTIIIGNIHENPELITTR